MNLLPMLSLRIAWEKFRMILTKMRNEPDEAVVVQSNGVINVRSDKAGIIMYEVDD